MNNERDASEARNKPIQGRRSEETGEKVDYGPKEKGDCRKKSLTDYLNATVKPSKSVVTWGCKEAREKADDEPNEKGVNPKKTGTDFQNNLLKKGRFNNY